MQTNNINVLYNVKWFELKEFVGILSKKGYVLRSQTCNCKKGSDWLKLGSICISMAASLCLKSCEDHSLLKSYNGGIWKNNNKSVHYWIQSC